MNWVTLGTEVMREARNRKGLSYEGVARAANVSAKTYERYEKAGHVPAHLVGRFATILELEIERPTGGKVIVESELDGDVISFRLGEIERSQNEAHRLLEEVLRRLPEVGGQPPLGPTAP